MQRLSLTLTLAPAVTLASLPVATLADPGSFTRDGVEIHFTDEGTGPAVVFLHAFAGSSALWTAAGLAPLEGRRTITYDARGHGASDKPTDSGAYGDEMVDDLAALLADRGIAAAHIVGYSMGAETALAFAAAHPDRVLSLTVAGSGWSGEEQAGTYGYVAEALSGAATFGEFMAAVAPEGAALTAEEQAGMMALLAGHGIDPGQEAAPLAAVAASMPEIIDLNAEDLARFDFPVLGLAGAADEERGAVERLAEAVAGFRFVTIAGADHLMAPLTPVFTETVTGFLTE